MMKNKTVYSNEYWAITYADGVVEYTDSAPYEMRDSDEYKRLVKVGNPVVKFEMVPPVVLN